MPRSFALIGVPTSAASHTAGQDKAPRYLRAAGLVERLRAAGLVIADRGDLPRARFAPDRANRRAQNLPAVAAIARDVAGRVDAALAEGDIPLVIGGDCTIELGVLAGVLRGGGDDVALLYVDAHADLNVPASVRYGALDWMGMAHILGVEGATWELSRVGPRVPLLADDKVVYFGLIPDELTPWERAVVDRRGLRGYMVDQIAGRAQDADRAALADIEGCGDRFLVHLDVDVIDTVDFPIADFHQLNAGLTFGDAMACLGVFAASPRFAGLTITEVNPDHADEDGTLGVAFAEGLARALATAGT